MDKAKKQKEPPKKSTNSATDRMPMKSNIIVILLFSLFFIGCGSTKELIPGKADASLSAKRVLKLHEKNNFDFNTLACRVGVTYEEENSSRSLTVSLRMEKDKTIWVSASVLGVTLAKILIEPDRVQYYETIDNTYFDGNFALLTQWLNVEVDFYMLQNLFLGQSLTDLQSQSVEVSVANNRYRLQPDDENSMYRFLLLLHPEHFKAARQLIAQPYKEQLLSIDYPDYQEVEKQIFPKKITITATEGSQQIRILLDYKKVDYNPSIRFPFSIPNGYDEIQLYE